MKKKRTDVEKQKRIAIKNFGLYLDSLVSGSASECSKADKLCYWIDDWTRFLKRETTFRPTSLRRYKRGEIIKVHLGFNIGSEEGGLHYAVVIDKDNKISDPTVRIIPLTSVKPGKDISNLPSGCIFLGNELFTSLMAKLTTTRRLISDKINEANKALDEYEMTGMPLADVEAKISDLQMEMGLLQRMTDEISKMKKGSIALVNQITTISKIRIYDPKTNRDILSNVKLSNEKLDMIDDEIRNLFTK